MHGRALSLGLGLATALVACSQSSSPLIRALASQHPSIVKVMQNIDAHEVQILFTRVTGDERAPAFSDYAFELDADAYFYPASTVKLPAAVLALEWADAHERIDADTFYATGRDGLAHTLRNDVRQIFSVSDDEAYNRLYEILGRDRINRQLARRNLGSTRIAHRVGTDDAAADTRSRVVFMPDEGGEVVLDNGVADAPVDRLEIAGIKKGVGYIEDKKLVSQAMDFSLKNHFPLTEQHGLMKRLMFPASFPTDQRFDLSAESRDMLLLAMRQPPRQQGYSEAEYPDGYGKFFILGDGREQIPQGLSIFNKVGWAYGTLSETAYVVDHVNDIRFFLSATILVNENGIFNDDDYQYEEVAVPFLAQLGREVLALERGD